MNGCAIEKARRIGEIRRASLLRFGDTGPAQGVKAGSEEGKSVTHRIREAIRVKVHEDFENLDNFPEILPSP